MPWLMGCCSCGGADVANSTSRPQKFEEGKALIDQAGAASAKATEGKASTEGGDGGGAKAEEVQLLDPHARPQEKERKEQGDVAREGAEEEKHRGDDRDDGKQVPPTVAVALDTPQEDVELDAKQKEKFTKWWNSLTPAQRKVEEKWKSKLTPLQFRVLRAKQTEKDGTGTLIAHSANTGVYACAACGNPLYDANSKFDPTACVDHGWPAFGKALDGNTRRNKQGGSKLEIVCSKCEGHLGHVFKSRRYATGERHCINSVSLAFSQEQQLIS